jgi:hypothetical protein
MATIPIFNAVRIIPRDEEFLNRKLGALGEIFYDRDSNSLRLYDGQIAGGISLATADLTNIPNSVFLAKATAAGVGSGGNNSESGASISVSPTAPQDAESGNLWFNSVNGYLYVYVDDESSEQWVQPGLPISNLAPVAFTGDYDDLVNVPVITETDLTGYATEDYVDTAISNISEVDLTGYATETFVGTAISNLVDTAPTTLNTLNELAAALNDDANFATTVSTALGLKAPINNPAFTESVGIGGAASVIQGTGKSGTYLDVKGFIQVMPSTGAASIDMGSGNGYRVAVLEAANSITPYLGIYLSNSSTSSSVNTVAIFRPAETETTSTTTGALVVEGGVGISGGITIGGLTTLQQNSEILNTKTSATGTVTHDFSTGSIWYHTGISANFTANFTNIPTTDNRTTVVTIILSQGGTAYIPNAVQINSSSATINWLGSEEPEGTAGGKDIVSFTLIRVSSNWVVLGSLSPYGAV